MPLPLPLPGPGLPPPIPADLIIIPCWPLPPSPKLLKGEAWLGAWPMEAERLTSCRMSLAFEL